MSGPPPGTTWYLRGTDDNNIKFKRLPLARVSPNMTKKRQKRARRRPQMCSTVSGFTRISFPPALEALQVLGLGIQLTRWLITCRFLMVTFEEPAILN